MELIGSPWQFPVFLMVISAPPVTRSQACSRPSSGYPVVCWYGIAIALHTASLAARVYASGGDSNMYQRLAYTDLMRPVRNALLLLRAKGGLPMCTAMANNAERNNT